ncbi:MAG TPA: tetratricopeptide repeat protein [Vicinamibacterales bacterium]
MTDLDATERLGLDPGAVDGERAAIYQAIGRYDDALAIRRDAVARRAGFETLAALAGLYAERGQTADAEQLYQESRDLCRCVSPFPLAMLDFQRGQMWMRHEEYGRASTWFRSACSRVAAYAPAQGHLAEVEAILGDVEAAIIRLRPLTDWSDDPDYPAHLARILAEAGRVEESRAWRARAAARYEQLMSDHAEAFADHAAEFWLVDEADPAKALRCAKRNYEVRPTPRALELLSRAWAANALSEGAEPTASR